MGFCVVSSSYQAYSPIPNYINYGAPHYGHHYQPKWIGPLASTIPAGVNGLIIPVSDTYEVSAAKNAFFSAYQEQLAKIGAYRYGSGYPHHHNLYTGHHVPAPYSPAVPAYGAVAHGPVQDTPAVAAAKAQFFHLYNKQAAAAAAAPDNYK
ncbi:hypothetical protein SK128_028132, partial [Halocaridina rubra]